jgi:hypothetical protein
MSPKLLHFISYAPHLFAAAITFGQDDYTIANGFHAADFLRDQFIAKFKV